MTPKGVHKLIIYTMFYRIIIALYYPYLQCSDYLDQVALVQARRPDRHIYPFGKTPAKSGREEPRRADK